MAKRRRSGILRVSARVVFGLLAVFFFLMLWQLELLRSNYLKKVGPDSPAIHWMNARESSHAMGVYDFLLALRMLESAYLQHELDLLSDEELSTKVSSVQSILETFSEKTQRRAILQKLDGFEEALASSQAFVYAVEHKQRDKNAFRFVMVSAEQAIDEWSLVKAAAADREFGFRDALERAIVSFQDVAMLAAWRFVGLCVLCMLALMALGISMYQVAEGEKQRFKRFEWLIGSVGHDLRSPLQAIESASARLSKGIDVLERASSSALIRRAIDQQSQLIDDILLIVRNDELSLEPSYVDLEHWFNEYAESFKLRCEEKGLKLKTKIDTQAKLVNIDVRRYGQMLGNLLENALRYTSTGGIEVNISFKPKGLPDGRQTLLTRVADSGQGVDDRDKERIFDAFERATSVAQRHGKGLGLSIVRNLARAMGGSVRLLNSQVGKGSVFAVSLPVLVRRQDISARPNLVSPLAINSVEPKMDDDVEVLLVDDDPNILDGMGGTLVDAGFSVATAVNGSQALQIMNTKRCRILISDIEMPSMSGHELLNIAKKKQPNIFAVAMTGHTTNLDKGQFDAVLYKPIKLHHLLKTIDMALIETGFKASVPAALYDI